MVTGQSHCLPVATSLILRDASRHNATLNHEADGLGCLMPLIRPGAAVRDEQYNAKSVCESQVLGGIELRENLATGQGQ